MSDPDYDAEDSFENICLALQYGYVVPGIKVSHKDGMPPKQFTEDDYPSDDELLIDREMIYNDDAGVDVARVSNIETGLKIGDNMVEDISTHSVQTVLDSAQTSSKQLQIDKYYKIMLEAEKAAGLTGMNPSPSSASPSDSRIATVNPMIAAPSITILPLPENSDRRAQSVEVEVEEAKSRIATTANPRHSQKKRLSVDTDEREGIPSGYLSTVQCWNLGLDNVIVRNEQDVLCDDLRGSVESAPDETLIQKNLSFLSKIYNGVIRFLRFTVFYMEQLVIPRNLDTWGPGGLRRFLVAMFLFLSIADFLGVLIIMIVYRCIFNTTTCANSNGIILVMTIWPGALIFSPIMGIVATTLGPSVKYARAYALWSRFAGISDITMVAIYVQFHSSTANLVGYTVLFLSLSRALQCYLVDLYIAHIEEMRWGRGWDGLSTCLYVTKDRRYEEKT
mgnify:CR=1 FL=1